MTEAGSRSGTQQAPRSVWRLPLWALPAELAVLDGWPTGRRTVRDWTADSVLFLASVVMWTSSLEDAYLDPEPRYLEAVPGWMVALDPWVGALGCLALWVRRRYPLALGVAMVGVLAVASTGYAAVLATILTLAIHRGWVAAGALTAAVVAMSTAFAVNYQPPEMSVRGYVGTAMLLAVLPLSWGLVVRFRRQLLINLRRDALRERAEQQRHLEDARRAERQRIAWEMHDVLAHRISLLSVHAGALAYRTAEDDTTRAPSPRELHDAMEVIRDNAHRALEELKEVLTVLRDDGANARIVLPMLRDLPDLIDEARAAGQTVRITVALGDAEEGNDGSDTGTLPRPQEQRTIYRVVQEGVTNARKHAPDAPVDVEIRGDHDSGITVEVANPALVAATPSPPTPGAEAGLTGLRERVQLDGGTLEHGEVDGTFRLVACLPWRR